MLQNSSAKWKHTPKIINLSAFWKPETLPSLSKDACHFSGLSILPICALYINFKSYNYITNLWLKKWLLMLNLKRVKVKDLTVITTCIRDCERQGSLKSRTKDPTFCKLTTPAFPQLHCFPSPPEHISPHFPTLLQH